MVRAEQLLDEGATIIDVGGESTRPGGWRPGSDARDVADGRFGRRRAAAGAARDPGFEAATAGCGGKRRYLQGERGAGGGGRGAEVVNDVSGFRWDPKMAKTLAELKVGAVLMHTRGRPEEWQSLPPIGDPVLMVKRELRQWAETARLAGIKRDHLVLDPGFGFGKRFEENYPLLAHFGELQQMGFPLLAGVSRKSFIGRMLARDGKDAEVGERLYGTLAAETALILKGAHIIRTHDVRFAVEAARVADAIVASGG